MHGWGVLFYGFHLGLVMNDEVGSQLFTGTVLQMSVSFMSFLVSFGFPKGRSYNLFSRETGLVEDVLLAGWEGGRGKVEVSPCLEALWFSFFKNKSPVFKQKRKHSHQLYEAGVGLVSSNCSLQRLSIDLQQSAQIHPNHLLPILALQNESNYF